MPFTLSRRSFIIGSSLLLPAVGLAAGTALSAENDINQQFAALEKRTGGRLGVSVLDTNTNVSFGHRQDERFAMCSTFKALAAAFVLARVDKGEEKLDRHIAVAKADLLSHSPIAEKHIADGMTVGELCDAAVTYSDNAAANILLASFGGPEGLTAWLRSIGDETTRLDRTEPALNEAKVGDPRDTTTPAAMMRTLERLLLEDVLSPSSRDQFSAWLVANTTGGRHQRQGRCRRHRLHAASRGAHHPGVRLYRRSDEASEGTRAYLRRGRQIDRRDGVTGRRRRFSLPGDAKGELRKDFSFTCRRRSSPLPRTALVPRHRLRSPADPHTASKAPKEAPRTARNRRRLRPPGWLARSGDCAE